MINENSWTSSGGMHSTAIPVHYSIPISYHKVVASLPGAYKHDDLQK